MINNKAQLEIAILKGLIMALAVVSAFLVYEVISAKTNDGLLIECKWDCSNAPQSDCVDGYIYRDITKCVPNNNKCWESEPFVSISHV